MLITALACSPSPLWPRRWATLLPAAKATTYLKLLLHCNHNQCSSVHMSALIPLKSIPLVDGRSGLIETQEWKVVYEGWCLTGWLSPTWLDKYGCFGIKPATCFCRPSTKWCPLWWRCLRMSPRLRRGPRRSSGRWTPTEMVCLISVHLLPEQFSFITAYTYTFRLYTVALRSTWAVRQWFKARRRTEGWGVRGSVHLWAEICSFLDFSCWEWLWESHWEAAQVCLFQWLRGTSLTQHCPLGVEKGTGRICCSLEPWYPAVRCCS